MEYILAFENTNLVMKAERVLFEADLHIKAVPLPDQISTGCGICLQISPVEIGRALKILANNHITEVGIYLRQESNGEIVYSKVEDSADFL
ncbi:MAG: DUF3343 domain-containing protein [Firmicutes bacterium]|nr:DUF3343 domain-containing protein [Bacillota bacterium]